MRQTTAMVKPHAVAMSALRDAAGDRAFGELAVAELEEGLHQAVTVPSRPRSGARVTIVSMTTRKRPARSISMPAATCSAPSSEEWW